MSDVISLISVPFPRRPPMTLFFSALARLHRSSRADGKFSIRWQGTDDLSCSVRLPRPRHAVHFSSSASPAGDLICPWFSLFFSVSFSLSLWLIPFKYLLSLFSYLIWWCIFFNIDLEWAVDSSLVGRHCCYLPLFLSGWAPGPAWKEASGDDRLSRYFTSEFLPNRWVIHSERQDWW